MKIVLWYLGLGVIIAVIATVVWHYFGGFAGGIVIIVPLAIIANGWLATWEDEQPGGFNNPRSRTGHTKQPDETKQA